MNDDRVRLVLALTVLIAVAGIVAGLAVRGGTMEAAGLTALAGLLGAIVAGLLHWDDKDK